MISFLLIIPMISLKFQMISLYFFTKSIIFSDFCILSQQYLHLYDRYDHFANILTKILDEQPTNTVDIIENISKDVKWAQFRKKMDTLRDEHSIPPTFEAAEKYKALFVKEGGEEEPDDLEDEMVSYYPSETGTKYNREGVGRWWEGKGEREEVSIMLPLLTIQIIAVIAPGTLFTAELIPYLVPKNKTHLVT